MPQNVENGVVWDVYRPAKIAKYELVRYGFKNSKK